MTFVLSNITELSQALYKGVRVWTRRVLEKAGERVIDVQGDDDDDDDDDHGQDS